MLSDDAGRDGNEAGQGANDLALAMALEAAKPDNFPAIDDKRYRWPRLRNDNLGNGEGRILLQWLQSSWGEKLPKLASDHQGDQIVARELGRRASRNVLAVFQDGRCIAEAENLVEAVADIENQL